MRRLPLHVVVRPRAGNLPRRGTFVQRAPQVCLKGADQTTGAPALVAPVAAHTPLLARGGGAGTRQALFKQATKHDPDLTGPSLILYTRSGDLVRTRYQVEEMDSMQTGNANYGGPGMAVPVARLRIAPLGAFWVAAVCPSPWLCGRQPDT